MVYCPPGKKLPVRLWVDLEFRIRIVSAIPDSLNRIPDSEAQDSTFHKQKFTWFGNPDYPTSRDTKRRPRIQLSLNFSLALLPKNVDLTMTWVNFKVFNYLRGYINTISAISTAFDLAAFRLSMIAPVKKSVNHSRTVASMRETGWEQQQSSSSQRLDSVMKWIRFWSCWSLLSLL